MSIEEISDLIIYPVKKVEEAKEIVERCNLKFWSSHETMLDIARKDGIAFIIKNILLNGMSVEEVSGLTDYPVEKVQEIKADLDRELEIIREGREEIEREKAHWREMGIEVGIEIGDIRIGQNKYLKESLLMRLTD